ncbi:MAG: hypothetical protein Q8R50_03640 [Sediminibacterium sp.]|nr:hypothetical protein [Sediminibacterium sp.]
MTIFNIPVFVINLKIRTDRKLHILREFSGKKEFQVEIIEACEHEVGAIGLWNSIKHILQNLTKKEDDFIILCEDDHQFTEMYSREILCRSIVEAKRMNADIILGGVSWMNSMLYVSENIYWVEKFSGLQFTVVFRKFFDKILEAEFTAYDAADYKISDLTQDKFFIFPFISIQKGFSYSDVTPKNNLEGRVSELFEKTCERAKIVDKVKDFYDTTDHPFEAINVNDLGNLTIPTYIINLPEQAENRAHIEAQFAGRDEFEVSLVDACKHQVGAVDLWLSIRKIVQMAIENDDDVIAICEDNHEFTANYSKEVLLTHILEAYRQGIDFLSGGSSGFGFAIPVTKNRFWISECLSTQFLIVYRNFFQKLLDEPYDDNTDANILISEVTPNKMLIYPFISVQSDFGNSDIMPVYNSVNGSIDNLFEKSSKRLHYLQDAYIKYQLSSSDLVCR